MIQLYSADVCPFAQRCRALLTHLRVDFEQHVVDLDDRDAEFLKLTPTGKVPLLVDGKRKLYESSVINEYLAERHGHAAAFAEDVYARARERLAMAAWDQSIAPSFYRSMREELDKERRRKLIAELQELRQTVELIGDREASLLSFHCAPFWARMDWLRELTPVPGLVDEWITLRKWLDAAVAQPAIQATLPDRDATVRRYRERFATS